VEPGWIVQGQVKLLPTGREVAQALHGADRSPSSHHLPVQLSSLVGRSGEVHDVMRLLASVRLLTLSGVGGVGKTRLALQVAAEVTSDHPGGVRFVELAPLSDAGLVPAAVAAALGINEQPTRPADASGATHGYADAHHYTCATDGHPDAHHYAGATHRYPDAHHYTCATDGHSDAHQYTGATHGHSDAH
jgi:hypothetical protein